MTPEIKSLKKGINDLLGSNLWKDIKHIKPTSENQQRVNEYILQAQGDLKRCEGNIDRALKVMEEVAEEIKDEPGNTPSDDHFTDEDHAQDQHFEEASAMAEELYSVIGFSR